MSSLEMVWAWERHCISQENEGRKHMFEGVNSPWSMVQISMLISITNSVGLNVSLCICCFWVQMPLLSMRSKLCTSDDISVTVREKRKGKASRWRESLPDLVEKTRRRTTWCNQEIICLVNALDVALFWQDCSGAEPHRPLISPWQNAPLSPPKHFPIWKWSPFFCSALAVSFYFSVSGFFFSFGKNVANQEYRVHYNLVNWKILFTLLGENLFYPNRALLSGHPTDVGCHWSCLQGSVYWFRVR